MLETSTTLETSMIDVVDRRRRRSTSIAGRFNGPNFVVKGLWQFAYWDPTLFVNKHIHTSINNAQEEKT
jgi:hypothetical protein